MVLRIICLLAVGLLTLPSACVPGASVGSAQATILGRVVTSGGNVRTLSAIGGACPVVAVTVNGTPVSIDFDEDCSFAITDVQAGPLVEVRIELVDLGVAGTVELTDVLDGEFIEIEVEPRNNSLTITVKRRATPVPSGDLPTVISDNNVNILLPAGTFDQDLTVLGNNFVLTGVAGESCDDPTGWTVITGRVVVEGNNAVFRNILFEGPIELRGNNARFINSCIGDELIVFGKMKGSHGNGHHHDDDDDNPDDDDDDGVGGDDDEGGDDDD
jgi:hypothetical protein